MIESSRWARNTGREFGSRTAIVLSSSQINSFASLVVIDGSASCGCAEASKHAEAEGPRLGC